MATRFYLPSSGAAAVSPAFDGGWELTTGADRLKAVTTKISSAFTTKGLSETDTAVIDGLIRQYVSDALSGNQTISGTVKGIIRASQSAGGADMRAQLLLKVVSNDGNTVRGTLLAMDAGALVSEFGAALTNRKFPLAWTGSGPTLTSVNALDQDRIVLEIGYRAHNTIATNVTGTLDFGDNSASDLAEDETGTVQDNPWIEFSQTLTFGAAAVARVTPIVIAKVAVNRAARW